MVVDIWWFVCLCLVCLAGLGGGLWIGHARPRHAWMAAGLALILLAVWAWLQHNPAVAVHAIPLDWLRYIEGTGSVPLFMFIMGVVWQRSVRPRQRRVTLLAVVFGVTYFLQGGYWMLQATPRSLLADDPRESANLQSVSYSCVPAACATVLNRLGFDATESEMAHLTRTRAGFGTTLIRAMDGLRQKLAGTDVNVVLLEPEYSDLISVPMPALTLIQEEMTRRHMIVVNHVSEHAVRLSDPQSGEVYMTRINFERVYCRQVLAFRR